VTGADASAFEAVRRLRQAQRLDTDKVLPVYDDYLSALQKVIAALDHHLPKRQWQRTAKANS